MLLLVILYYLPTQVIVARNSLEKFLKGRFFFGSWVKPRMILTEAKQIKEFLFNHSAATRQQHQGTQHSIGQRIGLASPQRRHAFQPVFYQSNIRDWDERMVECTQIMLQHLQDKDGNNMIIEISKYIKVLTSHIMLRTEFGGSIVQVIRLDRLLNQFKQMCDQSTCHSRISRSRFNPISKYNSELKAIEFQVKELLMEIIQPRVDSVAIARADSHGNDLLGRLLNEMYKRFGFINMQLIVDECMTCLFAGHEATTHLITWTLMLLARNPYWQDLVLAEINHICNGHPPTSHQLRKLNLLNMVIKESLRLYPPVTIIERIICEDVRLSDGVLIPKGVSVCIPVTEINQSKEIWGEDVHEFNPQRFASDNDSTAQARRHFLPFSTGPHHCPAQYYALMETKIILAMFISKFRFI